MCSSAAVTSPKYSCCPHAVPGAHPNPGLEMEPWQESWGCLPPALANCLWRNGEIILQGEQEEMKGRGKRACVKGQSVKQEQR